MRTSFLDWLKERIVENNGDYYGKDIHDQGSGGNNMSYIHPLHRSNDLDSRFASMKPNMSELQRYVDLCGDQQDAVTSLRNLAADSLSAKRTPGAIMGHDGKPLDQPESRGSRPNNWNNTLILQRLGFRDSNAFSNWFNSVGQEIVANMQKQKIAKQRDQRLFGNQK